ncbi:MAG: efflux RND transporter permease subunit [Candidatus Omnitrophota bacterium]|nr:efflux RND transporter permease subunit [Candidatus Omnitrophota bacterium]
MNLPKLSIRRPIAISMVFLIFLLLGLFALFRLPVELKPNVEIGNISVDLRIRGGVSPQEVEDRIAKPLEDALSVIDGLEDIITISEEGECRIILYFKPEINLDYAVVEVREHFSQVQESLPKEVERPVIAKYEYSQVPVVILGVTSPIRTVEELRRLAESKMKSRFSRIEGVAKVEVGGGREEKIFVELNEVALRSHGITIDDVIQALNVNNLNLVAGDVKRGSTTYLVRTVGQFVSLDDIKDLPINPGGEAHMVRIRDLAKVSVSYLDPHALARVNSEPSVSLYIQKASGANTIKVVEEVEKELAKLKKSLPQDVNTRPYFNHADYIKQAITTVRHALYIGAFLTMIVLWLFLRNFKYTLVVALTIPFSVITAFSLMYLSGISINVVTLSGIALGIGILVDSSIVVLENIFKKREELREADKQSESEDLKTTAEEGSSEVLIAIAASTLTTIVVFLPLFFVNKEIKRLYSGLALTVVFSLFASLFFSFTLVPLLASRISTKKGNLGRKNKREDKELLQVIEPNNDERKNSKIWFHKIYKIIERYRFNDLVGGYKKCINFVLGKRYLFIAGTVILLIIVFIQMSRLGREFIGIAEQSRFTVYVQMPSGTKIEISDDVVTKVEAILDSIPEIKNHTSRIKGWSSQIYVELKPSSSKRGVDEIIEEIRQKTKDMDPAFVYAQQPESVGRKEIMVEVFGPDYELLKSLAQQIGGLIQSTGKFNDVKLRMRSGRPEVHILFDRNKLALYGLTMLDVSNILHAKLRGLIATRFHASSAEGVMLKTQSSEVKNLPTIKNYGNELVHQETKKLSAAMGGIGSFEGEGTRQIETIARLEKGFRDTLTDIYNLSLRGKDNTMVYLQQIAEVKSGVGPAEIWRKNKERMVQVSADSGKLSLSESADLVNEALAGMDFPKDYHYSFGGDYDKMIRNQRELTQAMFLALFLVYLVLASVFESYTQPFIVLSSVPMAIIGVGIGLRLSGEPIGLGVYIGSVILIGIVVNNAIILIDYINRLRGVGAYKGLKNNSFFGARESIIKAVVWRLRPILMTSLTTILTMIPLIFQRGGTSSLWRPLAVTVVGGMITSTFLTLFIIPSIYMMAEDIKKIFSFIKPRSL